jgi:hypothetical protein
MENVRWKTEDVFEIYPLLPTTLWMENVRWKAENVFEIYPLLPTTFRWKM